MHRKQRPWSVFEEGNVQLTEVPSEAEVAFPTTTEGEGQSEATEEHIVDIDETSGAGISWEKTFILQGSGQQVLSSDGGCAPLGSTSDSDLVLPLQREQQRSELTASPSPSPEQGHGEGSSPPSPLHRGRRRRRKAVSLQDSFANSCHTVYSQKGAKQQHTLLQSPPPATPPAPPPAPPSSQQQWETGGGTGSRNDGACLPKMSTGVSQQDCGGDAEEKDVGVVAASQVGGVARSSSPEIPLQSSAVRANLLLASASQHTRLTEHQASPELSSSPRVPMATPSWQQGPRPRNSEAPYGGAGKGDQGSPLTSSLLSECKSGTSLARAGDVSVLANKRRKTLLSERRPHKSTLTVFEEVRAAPRLVARQPLGRACFGYDTSVCLVWLPKLCMPDNSDCWLSLWVAVQAAAIERLALVPPSL